MSCARLQTLVIVTCLLLCNPEPSFASDRKDSVSNTVTRLSELYSSDPATYKYLSDSVVNTLRAALAEGIFFTNQELLELLSPYRKVVWKEGNIGDKIAYYSILCNYAGSSGKDGEMLYYAEKIKNLEEHNQGYPSIVALSVISDYYNSKSSYDLTKALYIKYQTFVDSLPHVLNRNETDIRQLAQSNILLQKLSEALFQLNDTIRGNDILETMEKIEVLAIEKNAGPDILSNIRYGNILSLWIKAQVLNLEPVKWQLLNDMNILLEDARTPEYLKNYIAFALSDNKAVLFLDNNMPDSALIYVQKLNEYNREKEDPYTAYMITKYKARALYQKGFYKESADTLVSALIILEKFKSAITQDISDMMYARAKAAEQQILLSEISIENKRSSSLLTITNVSLIVVSLVSFFVITYSRRRQREKFLSFKLNLARSIHDEANPALLYAKTLLKARNEGEKSELEKHIEHTMQLIRSLSHDLKSENQYTLSDLIQTVSESLNKLNVDGSFRENVQAHIDKSRFLSHYQFTQLKAIINECITNTVKHASFNEIVIQFEQKDNQLQIQYSDNGRGWQSPQEIKGIGLKNIQERIAQMNGELSIENRYPNGYRILFTITLK